MRSPRTSGHELLRLFAEVSAPVYALDAQRCIVFMNNAAAEWLHVPPDQLLGRECRYRSGDADPISAMADALCPPPEVFQGRKALGVVITPPADNHIERRRADFIPLPGDDNQSVGALVIVHGEAFTDDPAIPADVLSLDERESTLAGESRTLHELLQKLRAEMATWYSPDRLIGYSSAMARVREQIKLAASADSTVLIAGPPGIGRQHVARTIHAATARGAAPHQILSATNQRSSNAQQVSAAAHESAFLVYACSVLPPNQLRTELDTLSECCKTFSAESRSTILFADVDRTPADIQTELCAWLDRRPQNLRVISTARESLAALAQHDAFHAELAQRLSTLVIELPPLADRRDDIPLLAQMFLEDMNVQGGKQLRGFAPEAMDRLVLYDWPGQIDELAAIVRQAFVQAEGFEITSGDLPKQLRLAAEAIRHPRPTLETIDLEKFLTHIETELIERALRQAKGNKSHAARLLGITRPRLYRRMVQLHLAGADDD